MGEGLRLAVVLLLTAAIAAGTGCGHSEPEGARAGTRVMSRSERAKITSLGTVLHYAAVYPGAYAGQAYPAAKELLHLCRTEREWIVNPPKRLIEVVHEVAAGIQASRPDLAGLLYSC